MTTTTFALTTTPDSAPVVEETCDGKVYVVSLHVATTAPGSLLVQASLNLREGFVSARVSDDMGTWTKNWDTIEEYVAWVATMAAHQGAPVTRLSLRGYTRAIDALLGAAA